MKLLVLIGMAGLLQFCNSKPSGQKGKKGPPPFAKGNPGNGLALGLNPNLAPSSVQNEQI